MNSKGKNESGEKEGYHDLDGTFCKKKKEIHIPRSNDWWLLRKYTRVVLGNLKIHLKSPHCGKDATKYHSRRRIHFFFLPPYFFISLESTLGLPIAYPRFRKIELTRRSQLEIKCSRLSTRVRRMRVQLRR